MSNFSVEVACCHVQKPEDVNERIRAGEGELTNASQIISISWDSRAREYLVTYRVRRWENGREG